MSTPYVRQPCLHCRSNPRCVSNGSRARLEAAARRLHSTPPGLPVTMKSFPSFTTIVGVMLESMRFLDRGRDGSIYTLLGLAEFLVVHTGVTAAAQTRAALAPGAAFREALVRRLRSPVPHKPNRTGKPVFAPQTQKGRGAAGP